MSRRHELHRRLRTLGEINDIMQSMRMLSLLETRKLSRFIGCQRRVVDLQKAAGADFLSYYPPPRQTSGTPFRAVFIVVGTERGFCGDFNLTLGEHLDRLLATAGPNDRTVFAVGRKLAADLETIAGRLDGLDGPSTAEEVPGVLHRLVTLLNTVMEETGAIHLTVIHHGGESGAVMDTRVIPAFDGLPTSARRLAHPPHLYLSPEAFLTGLIEQYLFAVLHDIVFTSLLHEHQRRVQHLDGATQRLEQTLEELGRQDNALRQEEITEELQVILLGADLVSPG